MLYRNKLQNDKMLTSVSRIYENGAVKRVMFDGGYATFSEAGVPGWHYFLCDHAGSVRVVADMGGAPSRQTTTTPTS